MQATTLLKSQHRRMEELFSRVEINLNEVHERDRFLMQLADLLTWHATIEEAIFYPAIQARGARETIRQSHEDHLKIRELLDEVLAPAATHASFVTKLASLRKTFELHARDEEADLFPEVGELFETQELESLGLQMQLLMIDLEKKAVLARAKPQEPHRSHAR